MSEILKAYLENEKALRRFLVRKGAGPHEVDDFAQEAFLRGFAAEIRIEISEPKAYLFRIAENITREKFRKAARSNVLSTVDSPDADLIIDEDQASADQWIDGRRKLSLFAKAVAQLPPQCRKAFLLRRIEGLEYKQIANRMDISISAVEKHVMAGLLKCNAYLKAHGYEPSEFGSKIKDRRERTISKTAEDGAGNENG